MPTRNISKKQYKIRLSTCGVCRRRCRRVQMKLTEPNHLACGLKQQKGIINEINVFT